MFRLSIHTDHDYEVLVICDEIAWIVFDMGEITKNRDLNDDDIDDDDKNSDDHQTAEEIHEIGLSEVARIEEEMILIVREMGWDLKQFFTCCSFVLSKKYPMWFSATSYENLTLGEFTDMIRTDPANFFDSPEGEDQDIFETASSLIDLESFP